jgi:hypothetical protein
MKTVSYDLGEILTAEYKRQLEATKDQCCKNCVHVGEERGVSNFYRCLHPDKCRDLITDWKMTYCGLFKKAEVKVYE